MAKKNTAKEDDIVLTEEVNDLVTRLVDEKVEKALESLSLQQESKGLSDDFPERLAAAEKKVREEAVIIYHEAHSRSQKRKEIEKQLTTYDDKEVRPYIMYSLETCPHVAPTVGGHDFPKYILKKAGKNRPDIAAKKVGWLTDREAARIRMNCEIKFMKIPILDEMGEPVLDKRSGAPLLKPVAYKEFIRLLATVEASENKVTDDPGALIEGYQTELTKLREELAEFRSGDGQIGVGSEIGKSEPGATDLVGVNKELKNFKNAAMIGEAEAIRRREKDGSGKLPV